MMNFLAGTVEAAEEDNDAQSVSLPTKSADKALPSWLDREQQPYDAPAPVPSAVQPPALLSSAAPAAAAASPLPSPPQPSPPPRSTQPLPAQSLLDTVRMLYDSPSPSTDIVQLVVSRLDDFPLLKLGRNGVAEMRSIFFSADGLELLWKGKRGSYDVVPVQKLVGVSLDFPVDGDADDAVAKLRDSQLSFVLQFRHRSIMLAARSELERRMFLSGVLCLRDKAAGCTVGQDIWQDIAPMLFETPQSALQLQPHAASVRKKRSSVVSGQGIGVLLSAAQSTQQHRISVAKPALPLLSAASSNDSLPPPAVVKHMAVQKRIVRAASEDIVIECRAQLMSDGTVVVLRDAAAHKEEGSVELAISSAFDVSSSDGKCLVWTSEVA